MLKRLLMCQVESSTDDKERMEIKRYHYQWYLHIVIFNRRFLLKTKPPKWAGQFGRLGKYYDFEEMVYAK